MISVKNLMKKYGEKAVLQDATITLPQKQIVAFIGGNGAGKSTLLSMISRLVMRTEGEIYVDDTELSKWKSGELAKKISVLNQQNHVNLRLTVRELVSFGRYPYSGDRLTADDVKKVDEAIRYMGIGELETRYLDELSGGQRQLAYIAMVIAQDTEYILLDEPLNNLDMNRSVQIMKCLRRLVDELGKTVLIVIHDINFVSCYADYIVALKDGKIVQHGPNAEIIRPDVLKRIYDMDIQISKVDGANICVYYS